MRVLYAWGINLTEAQGPEAISASELFFVLCLCYDTDNFLALGAISRVQYDKPPKDLIVKTGIRVDSWD